MQWKWGRKILLLFQFFRLIAGKSRALGWLVFQETTEKNDILMVGILQKSDGIQWRNCTTFRRVEGVRAGNRLMRSQLEYSNNKMNVILPRPYWGKYGKTNSGSEKGSLKTVDESGFLYTERRKRWKTSKNEKDSVLRVIQWLVQMQICPKQQKKWSHLWRKWNLFSFILFRLAICACRVE